jgi:hypothetical protein
MADWIFQASAREHDLDASIAASPQRWWGTPRYRVGLELTTGGL